MFAIFLTPSCKADIAKANGIAMEKNLRSLRRLTLMCLGAGAVLAAFYYFDKFHFGVSDGAVLFGGVAIGLLGCCSSVILKIFKLIDARLTKIEKSGS